MVPESPYLTDYVNKKNIFMCLAELSETERVFYLIKQLYGVKN